MKRSLLRHHAGALRAALAVAAAGILSACGDLARLVSPDGPADARPARVAFTATVSSSTGRSADDVVSLRVTSSYLLATGTKSVIGSQVIELTSAAAQVVPIPVDLASCLADATREGAASNAPCAVTLELALTVNSVVVDRQTVGPLRLAPGATTNVTEPVALFDITSVELAGAPVLALPIGGALTLSPTVRDSRGAAVVGRTLTFTSGSPAVATVDQNGRVAALTAGTARITATLGTLSSAVTVNVERAPVALSIAANAGSGAGVVRSTPAGIECRVVAATTSGICTFNFAADAQVTLVSIADAGQLFSAWGGVCAGAAVGANCSITMTQPQSASARFSVLRTLTITSVGTDGRGRVFGAAGVDCRIDGASTSGTCVVSVPDGAPVFLTGEGDAASPTRVEQRFDGWGADCASALGNTCSVTPTGRNATVSAGFFDGRTLSLVLDGEGSGRLTATGISCVRDDGETSGNCSSSLPYGTTVRLTPQPLPGSSFGGWAGACAGQGSSCDVTMTQARTATATFTRPTARLTVILAGSGNGVVIVNGVTVCSRTTATVGQVTCTREFASGARVTVSGVAGTQTDFAGYAGDCSGLAPCTLVMTAPRTVSASFASIEQVTITVGLLNAGSGTIVSAEATPLINCTMVRGTPADVAGCAARVPVGTVIALVGTGSAGNALSQWGGRCAGVSTHRCELTLTATTQVNVAFVPAIDVEMRLSGSGAGTIRFQPTGAPSQAPCELGAPGTTTSCRYSLPSGTDGVFRGTPAAGSSFAGISGPCAESVAGEAVAVCTYRGVGFLRLFRATFNRP